MKVIYSITAALAMLTYNSQANAQNTPGDESLSQPQISIPPEDNVIEEPSGADPNAPQPPPVPSDVQVPPAASFGIETAGQTNITITISQTFTNDPNSITIIGSVNSEQEKQAVQDKLQEAVPGKQINNHLTISGAQGITEPAGAETPEDEDDDDSEDENELDEDEDEDDVQEAGDPKG